MERGPALVGRTLVAGLVASSVVLSVVSWYTTWQGMALYLSPWLSILASLGIQSALVLVAWLTGFARERRALLVAVYACTALVSIAFSYVSLCTWFSARERPAAIERRLYDALDDVAGRSREILASAIAEGEKHAATLEEMAAAERAHGYASRAGDADPWLARVRRAVADEARSLPQAYAEGAGAGPRYTAFDRYADQARRTVARLRASEKSLADVRASAKPLEPADSQLRAFRRVFDAIAWEEAEDTLHAGPLVRPVVPAYSDFVDRAASSQEDLLVAFSDLFGAPGARQLTALALAAFIDVVVYLLAWATGPFLLGAPEQGWIAAGATLDGVGDEVFVRGLVRKLRAGRRGMAAVAGEDLTTGERQLCLVLAARGLAAAVEESGRLHYLVDAGLHERLVESVAVPSLALRAAAPLAGD
jgi:hypothetical protein